MSLCHLVRDRGWDTEPCYHTQKDAALSGSNSGQFDWGCSRLVELTYQNITMAKLVGTTITQQLLASKFVNEGGQCAGR
jgi:hypothetical protein